MSKAFTKDEIAEVKASEKKAKKELSKDSMAEQFGNVFGIESDSASSKKKSSKPKTADSAQAPKKTAHKPKMPYVRVTDPEYKPKPNNTGFLNHNKAANFRTNDELWKKFNMICLEQHIHASKVLNDFIEKYIEENGK